MVERKKSYVNCPKCGSEAFKVYDTEKVKKDYPDIATQTSMLRLYQCSNKECSHVWELSFMETLKAFDKMRKEEGKSNREIREELNREAKKHE